jgi:predicted nucleic acid-binding protein
VSCYFLEATAFAKLFVQEQGTDALIRLMEAVEDNRKLISASTPLEIYAAIRRREKSGGISTEDATAALDTLRLEAARMVQEPLNPAVLEAARQLIDRTTLLWPGALQLGAALVARDMFQGTEIIFVSASQQLLDAAKAEGFRILDPAKEAAEPVKEAIAETEEIAEPAEGTAEPVEEAVEPAEEVDQADVSL